jgi:hypothetical protein
MIRHLVKMLTITLAVVLVVSSLAMAAGPIMGTVAAIDRACRRIQWEVTQASDPSLPLFFSPSFRFQFRPVFRFPTWSIPPSPASICSD